MSTPRAPRPLPWLRALLAATLLAPALSGEAGVIVPSGRNEPDPAVLTLDEMAIDIWIDNGHARVLTRQIFGSHVGEVLEGQYSFSLPARALVSDFAVWDGPVRIPGVILERRRAEEIYQHLKWQAIDPGLLQMGERDAAEARRSQVFSARIVPIPAWGAKRVEMEYCQTLPVENLQSMLSVPLRPELYRAQTAGRLWITLEARSPHAFSGVTLGGSAYPVTVRERTPNLVRASWEGRNVVLSEDFTVTLQQDKAGVDRLQVMAHRSAAANEPGFVHASVLLPPSAAAQGPPRTVIAVFDSSLSIQWEALELSFQGFDALLRALRPQDRFNVILFHSEASPFASAPVAAEPAAIDKAIAFVADSALRGGTDLQAALDMALSQASQAPPGSEPYIVLFGDAGATRGIVHNGRFEAWYQSRWTALAADRRPRTFLYVTGDNANLPLARMLARFGGVMEWVRSTEPAEFKLRAFLGKIGQKAVEAIDLRAEPASRLALLYPLEDSRFPGSQASWVAQYSQPGNVTLRAGPWSATVGLPAQSSAHPHLPRLWAKARVDALLEKIEREGEDHATIDEIIRLSRKYKFVTPYTSFLAAPRSLLRPRVIRPGDPVLRVRTDESIASVTALFPFGLVKSLRYLPAENVWQTRFLAPPDMADGVHSVKLLLRDKLGRVFRESKTFVIAGGPPVVRARLDKTRYRAGETVELRVSASATTRTITARMYGIPPLALRWDPRAGANVGRFAVPPHLAPGNYRIRIVAEDFAHNVGSQEVWLAVAP